MVATVHDQSRYAPMHYCLACGSGMLVTYLDLGEQPLANDVHDGTVELATFPLAVNVCESCFHSQLTHSIDPDLLFRDYAYVSGTTTTLSAYFDEFVTRVEAAQPGHLRICDIAGNDGTLLAKFAAHGHDVLNVDPARNLTEVSEANGVPTYCAYWNTVTASELTDRYDVVVAMNVLGHVSDPLGFLIGCKSVLSDNGRIYIQTSQCEWLSTYQFDCVYAEHISYFTAQSFIRLVERAGLVIQEVTKVPVHGESYLWTLTAQGDRGDSVGELLFNETTNGYYDDQTYENFGKSAESTATWLFQIVDEYRDSGYAPIGYGAAAKGNTLLNFSQVDLDCIVDDNPLKIGLLTPGRNIPIVDIHHLEKISDPICVVVLAWNFYSEIRDRITKVRNRKNDIFVRVFPDKTVEAAW